VIEPGKPIPKGGGRRQVGKPYSIAGKVYTPMEKPEGYSANGLASWYGSAFHGRLTSNGEIFDSDALSAAHATLPLPSYVRVTNKGNGRSVVVRVNDRGPYHRNRVLDVSKKTAELLDFKRTGTAQVEVDYVGPADLRGSDDRKLLASYREGGRSAAPPREILLAGLPLAPGVVDLPKRTSSSLPAEPAVSKAEPAPALPPRQDGIAALIGKTAMAEPVQNHRAVSDIAPSREVVPLPARSSHLAQPYAPSVTNAPTAFAGTQGVTASTAVVPAIPMPKPADLGEVHPVAAVAMRGESETRPSGAVSNRVAAGFAGFSAAAPLRATPTSAAPLEYGSALSSLR